MLKRLIEKPQTSIFSAALIISIMVLLSRVFGLIRNRLLTDRFTTAELDPYFAAFRIPNFIFEILILGALAVAFIPVFTQYLSKDKKDEAFYVASNVISIASVVSLLFVVIGILFTPQLTFFIAPGLPDEAKSEMMYFTRIILLFQVIPLIVGNILTGISQSFRRFFIPALAPVLYNIGIIIGIVFLTPFFGLTGAVYGVVIGAFLFLIIQIPVVYMLGFRFRFSFDTRHKGVRQTGALMIPRMISVGAEQIDATVDMILASLVGLGSITIFSLAQQIQLVPTMLFAYPIAQASLPLFSELVAKKKHTDFKNSFITALDQMLFFLLPASTFLIVMKIPVTRLVYGADQFDWASTVLTARTTAAFALSIWAQGIVMLTTRGMFAYNDSKRPLFAALFSIGLNTCLSILFIMVFRMPIWALGLSATIASVSHAFLLLYFLDKKVGSFDKAQLVIPLLKIGLASGIMALCLYIPLKLLDQLVFDTTHTINLLLLTFTATCIGLATYLFFAWFLNIREVIFFYHFGKRVISVKKLFVDTSTEVVDEK
jgi:putative peptidoglycan lipid II flippase